MPKLTHLLPLPEFRSTSVADDLDWHPEYAVGVAGKRIIGDGSTGPGGRARAWLLDLESYQLIPPPNPFVRANRHPDPAIDPRAELLGSTSRCSCS